MIQINAQYMTEIEYEHERISRLRAQVLRARRLRRLKIIVKWTYLIIVTAASVAAYIYFN